MAVHVQIVRSTLRQKIVKTFRTNIYTAYKSENVPQPQTVLGTLKAHRVPALFFRNGHRSNTNQFGNGFHRISRVHNSSRIPRHAAGTRNLAKFIFDFVVVPVGAFPGIHLERNKEPENTVK